jgi:hypothetical protein
MLSPPWLQNFLCLEQNAFGTFTPFTFKAAWWRFTCYSFELLMDSFENGVGLFVLILTKNNDFIKLY